MNKRMGRYWPRFILGLTDHLKMGSEADQNPSVCLVPSARLELAQLSPLPPQDSVSTNFTTTAVCLPGLREEHRFIGVIALRTIPNSTLKSSQNPCAKPEICAGHQS
jgi:hypothetical protein